MRVAAAVVFALGLMGTAWLQRAEQVIVPLSPSGPYRIATAAGPIEVTTGAAASFRYDASWLLKGPTVVGAFGDRAPGDRAPGDRAFGDRADLDLRCDTAWPCRAASILELPEGERSDLALSSTDQDLLITRFDGTLTATIDGQGDVVLGPVGGSITAVVENGAVFGYGLTASVVDVRAPDGPVDLRFSAKPKWISVRSGPEPVTITLPPGDYSVSVEGESSIAINVGQASDAENKITINARGPVRIDPAR